MDWHALAHDDGGWMTVAEFERLPGDGSYRSELVRGRIVREPPIGSERGRIAVAVAVRIHRHARTAAPGTVFAAGTGFVLSFDPPTVRAPDVAFVSRDRIPADGLPRGFFPGAPDLAVEIVSAANSPADIRDRVADFLDAGARMVWVVEPLSRTLAVHRPDRLPRTFAEDETVDGGDVLPGLRLRVGEVFLP